MQFIVVTDSSKRISALAVYCFEVKEEWFPTSSSYLYYLVVEKEWRHQRA